MRWTFEAWIFTVGNCLLGVETAEYSGQSKKLAMWAIEPDEGIPRFFCLEPPSWLSARADVPAR